MTKRKTFHFTSPPFVILALVLLLIFHNVIEDKRAETIEEILTLKKKITKTTVTTSVPVTSPQEEVSLSKIKTFESPSRTQGLSKLQAFITEMARSSGLELLSVRPNPVIKYNYYEGVALYIEAKGEAGDVSEFLKKLSTTERPILISKISIKQLTTENPEELGITLEVAGLRKI